MGKFGTYNAILGSDLASGDLLLVDDISAVETKSLAASELANYLGAVALVLTNKTINAASNTISNIGTSMFATNVIDVDGTLAANSDTRIASQKAVKTYVGSSLTAYVGSSTIVTVGTIATGVWNGTAIAVLNGGTGATTASGARTNIGLGSVENTALSTWAGSTSITTLGTIGTGTWGGTTIAINKGGTGQTTAAAAFNALSPMTTSGDIIYGGASGAGTRLAKGSDGQVLKLASGLPVWGSSSASPAGSDTQVQFNDGGTTAGSTGVLWDKSGGAFIIRPDGANQISFSYGGSPAGHFIFCSNIAQSVFNSVTIQAAGFKIQSFGDIITLDSTSLIVTSDLTLSNSKSIFLNGPSDSGSYIQMDSGSNIRISNHGATGSQYGGFWNQTNSAFSFATEYLSGNSSCAGSFVSGGQIASALGADNVTIDFQTGNSRVIHLADGSNSITFANPKAGASYRLILVQPAGGDGTISWPTILWQGAAGPPSLTASANAIDIVYLEYDGTNYYGSIRANYA